ncbi:hypothetical protein WOLCODRAFT_147072 [Wolfiporia cocos MD-104 SS10]|uniref:Nitrate reductase [NADPH] n=1 Tax=Wolfiporia cocos (strain MD-104) TaxID=742152 RepID=A0A2H3ISK1_WOLCO|nr:hypothetical protein WOLCODRAFT_147072 [Wolfiporia cocos MD-104 SS10]
MPSPLSSASKQQFRPPWSTPHTVRLKDPGEYPASTSDSPDANDPSQHRPGARTGEDGGRKAGSYGGFEESQGVHPDEDERVTREQTLRDSQKSYERKIQEVRDKGGLEALLKDPKIVVTVRDVKQAVPNFKLLDPRHHAFARFVLPIAESAIKSQEWSGKEHPEDNEAKSDDKKGGDEKKDVGGKDGERGQNKNEKKDEEKEKDTEDGKESDIDTETERMLSIVIEEIRVARTLSNNDGKVHAPLKLLDGDAEEQLESKISVDDQATPDSWIPRSKHLLRLTGKHPLNAEPNLTALFEAGMITPTKLHYVRNHGPVAVLDWDSHRLSVSVYTNPELKGEGVSENTEFTTDDTGEFVATREWSMDEIADGQFHVVELPITIACDGNRRKEVNMIKRSAGYDWSASGVSTCIWRGIFLRDLLLATGLKTGFESEEWFLHMEGADQCSEGTYATSIPLAHAMDPTNDVMLVFGQNGRVLHPDHGYPLRIIIPGFVGGRQVKWLKKIWIAKEANTSHYHIWDNKVVPPMIDSKEHPLASAFFHLEDSGCYEQILQSIICKPSHDERVPLPTGEGGLDQPYKIEGFAYDGAGTKIQRVELSLDGGNTWKYCLRRFLNKPLRHGTKHWAWVFWSCEVRFGDLANCQEIIVRAFDTKKNTQPEHLTWNVMHTVCIYSNSWYRVRPSLETDPKTKQPVLHFRHPVAPGQDKGGWMKPNKIQSQSQNSSNKTFSLEEVRKHDKKDDAWIVLDGRVYDVTSVLEWHPGGAGAILGYAGKATAEATNEYNGIHDQYANSKRDECFIGVLSKEGMDAMRKDAERVSKELAKLKEERKDYALQPDSYIAVKLVKRKEITHDTRLYTFELPKRPNGEHGILALPICQHIKIALHFEDQAVLRSYTPVRPVLPHEEDGTFDLLIKAYLPTEDGPFPPGGTLSNYLDVMQEGEEIDIRGPNGHIIYKGHGEFEVDGKSHRFKKVNLVSGGSGLTPHWQLIHAILSDKSDEALISIIDSNKTYEDILMREELQEYADKHPRRFKLWHCLSKPPENKEWKYTNGHLDKNIMEEHFYAAHDGDAATFLCGPPGMIQKAAVPALKEMGFEPGKTLFGF